MVRDLSQVSLTFVAICCFTSIFQSIDFLLLEQFLLSCVKNYIPSFIKTLIDLNCLWFKSHIVFSLLKHAKTTLFFFLFFFQWWKLIQRHDWSLPGEAWIRPAAHIVRASPQRKSSSWWPICALTKARSAEFLAMACHGYHWDFLGNIKWIITIIISLI